MHAQGAREHGALLLGDESSMAIHFAVVCQQLVPGRLSINSSAHIVCGGRRAMLARCMRALCNPPLWLERYVALETAGGAWRERRPVILGDGLPFRHSIFLRSYCSNIRNWTVAGGARRGGGQFRGGALFHQKLGS